jgi:hypothetical protein
MSPTRREFLATSSLLPWLVSCGKEESPASPSTPVAPLAQIRSDPSWAPLKDEHVTFDQFVVSTARA